MRIYQPVRTATQQGQAQTRKWVLEFEPASPRERDPLMGWTSSSDMLGQVKLTFDSREDAIAYARKRGYQYQVQQSHGSRIRPKSYADNFRFDKGR